MKRNPHALAILAGLVAVPALVIITTLAIERIQTRQCDEGSIPAPTYEWVLDDAPTPDPDAYWTP